MKNKFFQRFFLIFTLVVTLVQSVINVNASGKPSSLPDSINIKVVDDVNLVYNTNHPGTERYKINANVKKTTNGIYVYCVEANKNTVPDNTTMSFDDEIVDAGLAYLINNGFPYNTLGFESNVAYAITQTAIWLYYRLEYGIRCDKLDNIVDKNGNRIDDYNGGDNVNHSSRKKMDKVWELYKAAKDAKNKGDLTPKITPTVKNNILVLREGALISEEVTIDLKNATDFEVSADNDAIIIDIEGNEKTSFKKGEKFRVKLNNASDETETTINVTIKTEGSSNKVYGYKSKSNLSLQKVVYGAVVTEKLKVSAKLNFNFRPSSKEIEFSKIDITTGKELPGAHLEVKDANGKLIEEWVSTNKTHYIKLKPGKYILKETIAPKGYELSTEEIEFEVKQDGTTTKVVMKNKPYIEVPPTALDASQTVMIIGGLLIGLGFVIIYGYTKKSKVC